MIYNSLHDFLYTGIGLAIGYLVGRLMCFAYWYNSKERGLE